MTFNGTQSTGPFNFGYTTRTGRHATTWRSFGEKFEQFDVYNKIMEMQRQRVRSDFKTKLSRAQGDLAIQRRRAARQVEDSRIKIKEMQQKLKKPCEEMESRLSEMESKVKAWKERDAVYEQFLRDIKKLNQWNQRSLSDFRHRPWPELVDEEPVTVRIRQVDDAFYSARREPPPTRFGQETSSAREICPGCNQDFSVKYLRKHKKRYCKGQ